MFYRVFLLLLLLFLLFFHFSLTFAMGTRRPQWKYRRRWRTLPPPYPRKKKVLKKGKRVIRTHFLILELFLFHC